MYTIQPFTYTCMFYRCIYKRYTALVGKVGYINGIPGWRHAPTHRVVTPFQKLTQLYACSGTQKTSDTKFYVWYSLAVYAIPLA